MPFGYTPCKPFRLFFTMEDMKHHSDPWIYFRSYRTEQAAIDAMRDLRKQRMAGFKLKCGGVDSYYPGAES